MNSYMNYLVEANFGLLLFLLCYVLLLNKETAFSFKRIYLITSILVSLIFPLVSIDTSSNEIPSVNDIVPSYLLPGIVVSNETEDIQHYFALSKAWLIIACVYLLGVTLAISRFVVQLLQLRNRLTTFKAYAYYDANKKYKIFEIDEKCPTFSFFNRIVIGETGQLTESDKALIIKHETVHVDKLHSLDVLLIEITGILFWFNPFIKTYKRFLTTLHEFEADEIAAKVYDTNQYCNLLARVALMSADFKIANHFNNSLTIKRITMMKTMKVKMNNWKVAASMMITASFFVAVACQDQIITEATEIAKASTIVLDVPEEVKVKYDELKKTNPSKKYIVVEATTEEGKNKISSLDRNSITGINVIKPKTKLSETARTFLIVEFNDQAQQLAETSKTKGNVYTLVEESAEPEGGRENFLKYILKNIKYPKEARLKKISGNVYVEFTIQQDGTLTDLKILKSADKSLDDEALRLVREGPKWLPAQQDGIAVNQKLVLPISFKMKDDENQSEKIKDADGQLPSVHVVIK